MPEAGFLVILAVVLVFSFVVFFGAPYLPTKRKQIKTALDLLDLKPGEVLLELGSGDGRVAVAAAKRGWQVVGYELNPLLVLLSRVVCWRYRHNIKIIWGNFWQKNWPPTDGIFVFLIGHKMSKLNKKIVQINKPIKLVSFAFKLPERQPDRTKHGVFLYKFN